MCVLRKKKEEVAFSPFFFVSLFPVSFSFRSLYVWLLVALSGCSAAPRGSSRRGCVGRLALFFLPRAPKDSACLSVSLCPLYTCPATAFFLPVARAWLPRVVFALCTTRARQPARGDHGASLFFFSPAREQSGRSRRREDAHGRDYKGGPPRATRAHSRGKGEQGEPAAADAADHPEKKKRRRESGAPSRHARERAANRLPRTVKKRARAATKGRQKDKKDGRRKEEGDAHEHLRRTSHAGYRAAARRALSAAPPPITHVVVIVIIVVIVIVAVIVAIIITVFLASSGITATATADMYRAALFASDRNVVDAGGRAGSPTGAAGGCDGGARWRRVHPNGPTSKKNRRTSVGRPPHSCVRRRLHRQRSRRRSPRWSRGRSRQRQRRRQRGQRRRHERRGRSRAGGRRASTKPWPRLCAAAVRTTTTPDAYAR